MFLGLIATTCAGVFPGAATYVNLVEHPARMETGTAAAVMHGVRAIAAALECRPPSPSRGFRSIEDIDFQEIRVQIGTRRSRTCVRTPWRSCCPGKALIERDDCSPTPLCQIPLQHHR